jgi:glucan phosphoethanolaminetransferase (alkaline phosphatase superfamily)
MIKIANNESRGTKKKYSLGWVLTDEPKKSKLTHSSYGLLNIFDKYRLNTFFLKKIPTLILFQLAQIPIRGTGMALIAIYRSNH